MNPRAIEKLQIGGEDSEQSWRMSEKPSLEQLDSRLPTHPRGAHLGKMLKVYFLKKSHCKGHCGDAKLSWKQDTVWSWK